MKKFILFLILFGSISSTSSIAQSVSNKIELEDLVWNETSPAGMKELNIPSEGSLLQGLIYKANGTGKHPTLLLLHGYPGNERNLDLAQVVRAKGWNVIYFNYRGSWASQGKFSFMHCVEDVVNVVKYCEQNQDDLQIDPSNIVLFGHSMGGWICLKAIQQLPAVKKGFALSTWNMARDLKNINDISQLPNIEDSYFVLNTPAKEIYRPVIENPAQYDLVLNAKTLAKKEIMMLDEHAQNKDIVDAIRKENPVGFDYQVWETDHGFTNKRVSLMNLLLEFLNK